MECGERVPACPTQCSSQSTSRDGVSRNHGNLGRMIFAVLQRGRGVEDKGGPDWVAGDRRKTERLGASGEEFVPPGESGCYVADFGDEGFLI